MKKKIFLFMILFVNQNIISKRSIYRPIDLTMPEIITHWDNDPSTLYSIADSHLEPGPIFKLFNKKEFEENQLPSGVINFKSANGSITGEELGRLAEHLLKEINRKKKEYKHFTLLKGRDFSKQDNSGLLIFKYKDYPFVLKLFIENPESFVNPFAKGFEPSCLFILGGGVMRHLTGFTRIPNRTKILSMIKKDPYWSKRIEIPRKWYWQPKDNRWIIVQSKNLGKNPTTKLPSVYAIISDAITPDIQMSLWSKSNRQEIMDLAVFLEYRIDPHIKNFMITNGKLVIIDTEHFPTLVGIDKNFYYKSYMGWYTKLAYKGFKDWFLHSKLDRQRKQTKKFIKINN